MAGVKEFCRNIIFVSRNFKKKNALADAEGDIIIQFMLISEVPTPI